MSINYAEKYADIIDERFAAKSYTDTAVNKDYDFDGVNKVSVYSVPTVPLVDYDLAADENRYGTPSELGNSIQTLTLTQDKAFTFTIDNRNLSDTMKTNSAAVALKRQLDEVVTPTIDKYRISVMAREAGSVIHQVITNENAYTSFLNATAILTNCKIPTDGRLAFVTPEYYSLLKLDSSFTSSGDKAHDMAQNGVIDRIDGTGVILMPVDYFPAGVNYIITHPMATTSPIKLSDYIEHQNPRGINGWVVEGRVYYDAFVLNNKRNAILVSKDKTAALGTLTVTSAAGTKSGDTKITVSPALTSGNEYRYRIADAEELPVYNETCITGWQEWDGTSDITAETGKTIIIAEVNASLCCKKAGSAAITAKA